MYFSAANEIIVHLPEYCREEQRKCSQLHCPYGIEKFVDAEDCERCRCNNPCREQYCPEGSRCAVDLHHDEAGKIVARGLCREGILTETQCENYTTKTTTRHILITSYFPLVVENKPGQCPVLASGGGSCTAECQSDADCPGPLKCCASDCSNIPATSCMHPVDAAPVAPQTTSPQYHLPFYGGTLFVFIHNSK